MNKKIGDFGKVYKLTSLDKDNESVYIGSTSSNYFSVRLCQHAEAWRNGKDYHGIFNEEGKCQSEILDTVEKTTDQWLDQLRKLERYHLSNQTGKCINIRKPCYYDDKERRAAHNTVVKKYHKTDKGVIALRKSVINQRIRYYDDKLIPLGEDLNNYLKVDMNTKDKLKIMQNSDNYHNEVKDKFEKMKVARNKLVIELWSLDPGLFPGCCDE